MSHPAIILTDDGGRPFLKPERSGFPDGIEGTIAWMRARNAWTDRVVSHADSAFDAAFRVAIRRPYSEP